MIRCLITADNFNFKEGLNLIFTLLKFCFNTAPLMIIVEYMPNGNLKDYLRQNRPNQTHTYNNVVDGSEKFTSRDLLSYARQTARGMEHLARYDVSYATFLNRKN